MSNADKSEQSEDRFACSWCGRRLLPAEQERGWACDKCARLLRGAGVSDEKIFAQPESPDEEKRPL